MLQGSVGKVLDICIYIYNHQLKQKQFGGEVAAHAETLTFKRKDPDLHQLTHRQSSQAIAGLRCKLVFKHGENIFLLHPRSLTWNLLVGAQPSPCCSFARHLVGNTIIHCSFAHH